MNVLNKISAEKYLKQISTKINLLKDKLFWKEITKIAD